MTNQKLNVHAHIDMRINPSHYFNPVSNNPNDLPNPREVNEIIKIELRNKTIDTLEYGWDYNDLFMNLYHQKGFKERILTKKQCKQISHNIREYEREMDIDRHLSHGVHQ